MQIDEETMSIWGMQKKLAEMTPYNQTQFVVTALRAMIFPSGDNRVMGDMLAAVIDKVDHYEGFVFARHVIENYHPEPDITRRIIRGMANSRFLPHDFIDWLITRQEPELVQAVCDGQHRHMIGQYQINKIISCYPMSNDLKRLVINMLADRPSCDLGIIHNFFVRWSTTVSGYDSNDHTLVQLALEDVCIPPIVIENIWDKLSSSRVNAMSNPQFPESLFEKVVEMISDPLTLKEAQTSGIWVAALKSPRLKEEYLYFFSNNLDAWVFLAENPNLPQDLFDLLGTSANDNVISGLLSNRGADIGYWNTLLAGVLRENRQAGNLNHFWMMREGISMGNLQALWEKENFPSINRCTCYFENKTADDKLRLAIIGYGANTKAGPTFMLDLSALPGLSKTVIDSILEYSSFDTQIAVSTKLNLIGQKNIGKEALNSLTQFNHPNVRMEATRKYLKLLAKEESDG